MSIKTIGQLLLTENSALAENGLTIDIDGSIPLDTEVLEHVIQVLADTPFLIGLQVIGAQDEILGIISLDTLLDYLDQQVQKEVQQEGPGLSRGNSIGRLQGIPFSPVPLYRCPVSHQPPSQRLSGTPPKCRICGHRMEEVEVKKDV